MNICYCGHDCSRCLTYLATINNDENLREKSRQFYKEVFNLDISLEKLHCYGGHSKEVFYLCSECPWVKCCMEKGISACSECDIPCEKFIQYRDKYVNKCNQFGE